MESLKIYLNMMFLILYFHILVLKFSLDAFNDTRTVQISNLRETLEREKSS